MERYGYDEVNLNVGCPSCRVATKGEFGCSLMKRPEVVRDAIHAMRRAVQIPVTVKCRLGVDDCDQPEYTREFVRTAPRHIHSCLSKKHAVSSRIGGFVGFWGSDLRWRRGAASISSSMPERLG